MSLDREALETMELRDLRGLLASVGAEFTLATKPTSTDTWRVILAHAKGGAVGYGLDLLTAVIDAVLEAELAGGLDVTRGRS